MSTTTGTAPTNDAAGAAPALAPDDAVALLYGEPLYELPADLYIPPQALEIFLEAFEGPLDLLLYLIRKQNFNILDIPMLALTRQYLAYIEQIRQHNLELAADYLLMAALLIEIKSRVLLPTPPSANDEEPEDPRAELVRRLLLYEQFKRAAAQLAQLPQCGAGFFVAQAQHDATQPPQWPDVTPHDLQAAWRGLQQRAQLVQSHRVLREPLSVREHMTRVLRQLGHEGQARFENLFDPAGGAPVLVVTLLAVLELARSNAVELAQSCPYAPIEVRLAGRQAAISQTRN